MVGDEIRSTRLVPLDAYLHPVIDGLDEILFGAEVAFGSLDGGVAEQQLDLLQFPARLAAQFGAGSPEMPHAAFAELYRIQNYAESILKDVVSALSSRLSSSIDSA